MIAHRSLLIIIVICLAAVWTAAAVKIAKAPQKDFDSAPDKAIDTDGKLQRSPMDRNFLESGKDAGQKPQAQEVPVSTPRLTAKAYLVGDAKTGKIYLERNSSVVLPVASMSKLVTAFVATDVLEDSHRIEITDDNMSAPPDKSNLSAGESFTLKEILHPLLLSSSNVAAEAIASSTDNRTDFLEAMSSYSWEIGMPNTYFADPSGVNPRNAASARDLFALAKYLANYRPDVLEITRLASTTVATTTDHGAHVFSNTHPFVNDKNFLGGKTGRTPEAGETMMTIMDIGKRPIAIIVLGSDYGARESDTRKLLAEVANMLVASAN